MLNKVIDKLLDLFKPNKNTKIIAIILSSIMFIWSGIDKISIDKNNTLVIKPWPVWFSTFGMILVILLEILAL